MLGYFEIDVSSTEKQTFVVETARSSFRVMKPTVPHSLSPSTTR